MSPLFNFDRPNFSLVIHRPCHNTLWWDGAHILRSDRLDCNVAIVACRIGHAGLYHKARLSLLIRVDQHTHMSVYTHGDFKAIPHNKHAHSANTKHSRHTNVLCLLHIIVTVITMFWFYQNPMHPLRPHGYNNLSTTSLPPSNLSTNVPMVCITYPLQIHMPQPRNPNDSTCWYLSHASISTVVDNMSTHHTITPINLEPPNMKSPM